VSSVVIKYDGTNITDLCSIEESTFTTASTSPGSCSIAYKDTRQRYRFTPGKQLELIIDGKRAWDGYLISVEYNYWFATHTANCEPCPHVTPRKLILKGADRNVLLFKRVMYDHDDPTNLSSQIWPAGTADRVILIDAIERYVDDLDGVDYTSMVEEVASPDYWQEIRPNGPGTTVYDLFKDIAKMTGAVFYIDPDRRLIYTDVETPNAAFKLSDRPGTGEVGYRDLLLLKDASQIVNDALIWGAGQGSDNLVFHRTTDNSSVALHGRWQNTDGFRSNLWKLDSAKHTADTIVYGSPQNKRGRKDPAVSVRCTIFEPGLRVGEKVEFESEVHGFSDVIPIREMIVTFPAPDKPMFELFLSHEFDEPWTTREFWWPKEKEKKEPPPGPEKRCWLPIEGDIDYNRSLGLPVIAWVPPHQYPPHASNHISQTNNIDTFNNASTGIKPFYWFDYAWEGTYHNRPGLPGYEGENPLFFTFDIGAGFNQVGGFSHNSLAGDRYLTYFSDIAWYWGGGTYYYHDGWISGGDRMWEWASSYISLDVPDVSYLYKNSPQYSSDTLGVRLTCTFDLTGKQESRTGAGWVNETSVGPSGDYPLLPHSVLATWGRAPGPSTTYAPRTYFSNVLTHETISPGETIKTFDLVLPARTSIMLGCLLWDTNMSEDVGRARVQMGVSLAEFFPVQRGSSAYIGDLKDRVDDPDLECIPLYGGHCMEPRRDIDGTYRTGKATYMPNSLRVYLDGIHLPPHRYTEHSSRGEFVLHDDPGDAAVWVCFEVASASGPTLPDTSISEMLFVYPVNGYKISGIFGPQASLWPPAVWRGEYYAHFHNGVDFATPSGVPVYAAAAGRVVHETQSAGGVMIHIYHPFHGFRTTYAHLSSRVVEDGETVAQGQHIGYTGNTGWVTGAHLHWGLVYGGSPENPLPYTQTPASESNPPPHMPVQT
jgi:hypothetical protein